MRVRRNRAPVALLGLVGVCAISVALADPPTSPSTTAPAATPAATAASTAVTAKPEANAATDAAAAAAEEKRLLTAGYKPEMRNGTKIWCRREQELGSRLGGQKVCGSAEELKLSVQENQEIVQKIQKTQMNPSGR